MAAFTTIDDAGLYFNPILWTGNSPSTQALTGVGFQPDLVWAKKRSSAAAHCLTDSVRGATVTLFTDSNLADTSRTAGLTAFGADGFTVGADGDFNGGSATFVGWNWKAGTTTGLSGGDITPSGYSFNATSGFSIVTWAGTGSAGTIPHGLGVAPQMIIIKKTSANLNWLQGNEGAGWTRNWIFNEAEGISTNTFYNDTAPTSTVFSVDGDNMVNASGSDYIAYVWAPVKGYSAFGKYIGNGNADGPFIYTGFRPAWLMVKRFATGVNWQVMDNKRLGYNEDNYSLYPNNTAGDNVDNNTNFLSNGFKQISTEANDNTSSGEYQYSAFAECPFVNSSGVPGNAR